MKKLVLGCVWSVVAMGLGCESPSPLATVQLVERPLPGFSISLPSVETEHSKLGYAEGKVELKDVGDQGHITVNWEQGGDVDGEWMEGLGRAVAGSDRSKPKMRPMEKWPGPQGTALPTVIMASPMGTLWISAMRCGDRRVAVFSAGLKAMGGLHRRILPTLRCQPVPAEEAKLKSFPWTVELPAGWFLVEAPPGRVSLTDGERGLVVRAGIDPFKRESLRDTLTAAFLADGMKVTFEAWEGDQVAMRGTTAEGEPFVGWVRLVPCPATGLMVMALDSSEAGAAELATLVAAKGRCVKDGEVAPPWPEAPQETAPAQAEPK